jgi:hypothetical protein
MVMEVISSPVLHPVNWSKACYGAGSPFLFGLFPLSKTSSPPFVIFFGGYGVPGKEFSKKFRRLFFWKTTQKKQLLWMRSKDDGISSPGDRAV